MRPKPPNKISEYGALILIAALFLLVVITVSTSGWFGCGISSEIESRIGTVESSIGTVETRLGTIESGRDTNINEPVTGWIMAAGYALIPVSFLAYMLMHRSRLFRRLKSKVRGPEG